MLRQFVIKQSLTYLEQELSCEYHNLSFLFQFLTLWPENVQKQNNKLLNMTSAHNRVYKKMIDEELPTER